METNKTNVERLYKRLRLNNGNAFFFVVCDSMAYQREIVRDLGARFDENETRNIDFYDVGSDFIFSTAFLRSHVNEKTRVLFLVNFNMAVAQLEEQEFFQILNLSRDSIADIHCAIVFMMPLYFRTKLARTAPDFNSFVRFRIDFELAQVDKTPNIQENDAVEYEYTEANKKLLEYYRSMYNNDDESFEAFEIVANLLYVNRDLRLLHYTELNHFNAVFDKLLLKHEKDAHDISHKIARILESKSDYRGALLWLNNAFDACNNATEYYKPKTGDIINDIGLIYARLGEYPNALEQYQKALDICEKLLGLEHPNTATIYNNIAEVYDSQGDYPKALEWFHKALHIREKVLGLEHPDTATTYNNIALVYSRQGDFPKALEWYHKSLNIKEKVLGLEHPDTAMTYNNIAGVYDSQGDYQKALEWYHNSLNIKEKVLGLEHPSTATTYNNIAGVYDSQGDYPKAMEWYRKALIIFEKVLGSEHPNTITIKNNISYTESLMS
ncbi:MAG: tetratricopeptide repeat protein [Defluviitaleaceae bacterium]|nr:tetratricopeptide repeat protein [Defluviitaleaceae bacterium]MCL2274057.1 tetratricopeptide repeat protein [Defluviitaleaceae bacterium]